MSSQPYCKATRWWVSWLLRREVDSAATGRDLWEVGLGTWGDSRVGAGHGRGWLSHLQPPVPLQPWAELAGGFVLTLG